MKLAITLPIPRVSALLTLVIATSALAAPITGTVTNRTTNKPASGDDVVLLSLRQNMQEAARVKTDAQGKFTVNPTEQGPFLIRVDHQKAGYFRQAPPGTTTVDIDIYDVAAKVSGVSTEADVMRVETDAQGLHVLENFFVKNESAPPKTQLSEHSFELYIPEGAQIEASAAMAPGGMPVSSSPVPLGEKGHYAFVFPLRPGETRFQLSYHLPYSGSLKFTPKLAAPAENFVVILPKAMTFKADSPASFQPINDDVNAQTFLARSVQPSQPLGFTLSGSGSMPRESQGVGGNAAPAAGQPGDQSNAAADTRPGGGLGNPIDTPDPLDKYKWWILSGLAVVLAAAAAFFLRGKQAAAPVPAPAPATGLQRTSAPGTGSLLGSLKDELFAIETDRLEGKLSEEEYVSLKSAFEIVLRRALARQSAGASKSITE